MDLGRMYSEPVTQTYQVAATLAAATVDNFILLAELPMWLGRRRPTSIEEEGFNATDLSALLSYSAYGEGEWVFVYNNEGADWAAGEIITRDDSTDLVASWGYYGTSATASGRRDQTLGICQHAIVAGYGGWIKKIGSGGMAEIRADAAGFTRGDAIVPSATAGRGDVWVAGEEHRIIGVILETVGADAYGTVLLTP